MMGEREIARNGLRARRAALLAIPALLTAVAALLHGAPRTAMPAAAAAASSERAEAFEIGPDDLEELPRGKEADGIIGDFVLRNAWVEALVSGDPPGRKANMTTNSGNPTPGCLYDLSVRGSGNDQLTCLYPGGLEGAVSSVRIIEDGRGPSQAEAAVRVERSAALGGGLEEHHTYRLGPGWRHLLIVSRYRNLGRTPRTVKPGALWKGLSGELSAAGIRAAEAMDPQDRQGYAVAFLPRPGAGIDAAALIADDGALVLRPGEEREFAQAVAPGLSPAEAFGAIASLKGPTGVLRARVADPSGAGVLTASVEVPLAPIDPAAPAGKSLAAYPGPGGLLEVRLPPGDYEVSARDIGRPEVKARVRVAGSAAAEARLEMAEPSRITFEVTDAGGGKTPLKAQFIGLEGTRDPDLGPVLRARGCRNQYHSETGWFTAAVPPGRYRVVVTRGIEFDHLEEEVEVKPGAEVRLAGALRRVVDSRGWISTDFHSHSTPSGDNYCGTDDRIINLAAEGVEFAPTTEHNRFYDWAPHIRRLGLEAELSTLVGIELTGPGPHLNSFPHQVRPGRQDGGAPVWVLDPRINALNLRHWPPEPTGLGGPERWVQVNHPAVGQYFRDRDEDGRADGGYVDLERHIDAAEFWSANVLDLRPVISYTDLVNGRPRRIQNRTFAWLQLLNQGRRMWCVAVSDAHEVFNGGVGGWRTYVPASSDEPARLDAQEVIRHAKSGRMVVTNGPFLEASLADGTAPGGSTVAAGRVDMRVRVQCSTWLDIDRVQVLVNGRARPGLDFTRRSHPRLFSAAPGPVRFEGTLAVDLEEDAWLIAVAFGEGHDLRRGFGSSWQGAMHPCAFHNPIYVDVEGNGFRANGDTLGHPLPVAFPVKRTF